MLLITGIGGLLGTKVIELARKKYEVRGTYHNQCNFDGDNIKLDITEKKNVFEIIKKFNPACIIHCAALTDVDLCETEKKRAWNINVNGTKNIAEACNEIDSKLIYISTDYVFDGKKGMYKEDDIPNPLNYYAKTKLEGEKEVKKLHNSAIVRTSVIYGAYKNNFVTWVIDFLKRGKKINVFENQFNSPTLNSNLAEALIKIYEEKAKGIYNCSGSERISRSEFAKKIADIFGLDKSLITPVSTDNLKQKAKRPEDSSLDVSKAEKELDIKMLDTENGLKRLKKEMNNKEVEK